MSRLALHWQIAIGMVAGAAIGVVLNAVAGTATTSFSSDLPAGLTSVTITDTVGRMVIETVDEEGAGERVEVGHAAADDGLRFHSLDELATERPELARLASRARTSPANLWGGRFQRLGNLFLRMLKMVAVPLVVASLASGIMGLGGAAHLGRMFGRTIAYYVSTASPS